MDVDPWWRTRRRLGVQGPEVSAVGVSAADATSVSAAAALAAGVSWIHLGPRTTRRLSAKESPMLGVMEIEADSFSFGSAIERAVAASMAALGRPTMDVLLLRPTTGSDVLATWNQLGAAVGSGVVRAIGLAGATGSDIERCHRARHVDAVLLESLGLSTRAQLIRMCRWSGIGVIEHVPTSVEAAKAIARDGVTAVVVPVTQLGFTARRVANP